jgi:hypothetical protein
MTQAVSNRKPRWRTARRKELHAQGIVIPKKQHVFLVEPTTLPEMPEWAEKRRVKGFGSTPGHIWLMRGPARLLIAADHYRSKRVKVEFKRCVLCRRPMIAAQAEAYRKQLESGDRSIPCGPDCDARELRIYAA